MILITSDRWGNELSLINDEDEKELNDCIPRAWVNERREAYADEANFPVEEISFDEVFEEMKEEFISDNTIVDEILPDNFCRAGNDYYRYDGDGLAEYIGDKDDYIEAMTKMGI